MDRHEIKQLLIATVRKELEAPGIVGAMTAEEWINYCLDSKDISLLSTFLCNGRDLPREQREAVVAYVRHKEHQAVDTAYDNCINQFEREFLAASPAADAASVKMEAGAILQMAEAEKL